MDSTAGSFNRQENNNNLEKEVTRPIYASKPTFATRNRSIPLPNDDMNKTKEEFMSTGNFQEKIPLKDRIQRSDEKKNTAPQQLYLPGTEEPIKKIQIQKQPEKQPQPQQQQQEQFVYQPSIGQQNKREGAMLGSKNTIENKIAVADAEKVQEQLRQAEVVEDITLILCPEGCGRQFKQEALEKHIKVCRTVFQQKRAEFNSKQMRVVAQDQQKLQRQGQIKEKQNLKTKSKAPLDPNWKKQSEELRNLVKEHKQQ